MFRSRGGGYRILQQSRGGAKLQYFSGVPWTKRKRLVSFSLHQTPAQTPRWLDVLSSPHWDSLWTGSRLLSDRRSSLLTASRSTVLGTFNLTFNLLLIGSQSSTRWTGFFWRGASSGFGNSPRYLCTPKHSQVSNISWDWSTDVDQATPAQHARSQTQLLAEFSDVLRDPADFEEEDVLPPMRGPPMNIHLVDFQSVARPLPCAWHADVASTHGTTRHHRAVDD